MRGYSHLSDDEREQIGLLKVLGHSIGAIARALRRPKSTISRELSRNRLPSLIHLMRDLNNYIYKEPFNREIKEVAQDFAALLKPIIETIDRFGLKARFLKKHKLRRRARLP